MRILIDPGHRNNSLDFGACANGQKESLLALSISKKLKAALSCYHGVDIALTRASEAETISISGRYKKALNMSANLLISVHINAADNIKASGIEVLHKHKKALAEKMVNSLCCYTKAINRGAKYRDDLGVLNGFSNSILIECGFITSADECKLLSNSDYQDKIVTGIVDVLVQEYKLQPKEDTVLKDAAAKVASKYNLNLKCWDTMDHINLNNVVALLDKLGGLDALINKGIITNKQIWLNNKYNKQHVRSLIIKLAKNL